tara:strand:- start:198 stop:374 length:177 start_codon:yes stop_codon:yes gene_type:complete
MDEITLITKTQKSLQERLQTIGDALLAGGVDSIEKYRFSRTSTRNTINITGYLLPAKP